MRENISLSKVAFSQQPSITWHDVTEAAARHTRQIAQDNQQ